MTTSIILVLFQLKNNRDGLEEQTMKQHEEKTTGGTRARPSVLGGSIISWHTGVIILRRQSSGIIH